MQSFTPRSALYRARARARLAVLAAVVAAAGWLATMPKAQAATVVSDNTAATTDASVTVADATWVAASFDLTSDLVSTDTLLARLLTASTSGAASLTLYASDASGLIPDAALASFSAVASPDGSLSYSLTGTALAASTYWVVLSHSSGQTDWAVTFDALGSGSGYTGAWANSDDAGASWFANGALYPVQMLISTSAVPEPGTLNLALLGAAGLMLVLRHQPATHVGPDANKQATEETL